MCANAVPSIDLQSAQHRASQMLANFFQNQIHCSGSLQCTCCGLRQCPKKAELRQIRSPALCPRVPAIRPGGAAVAIPLKPVCLRADIVRCQRLGGVHTHARRCDVQLSAQEMVLVPSLEPFERDVEVWHVARLGHAAAQRVQGCTAHKSGQAMRTIEA
jgi:hypothetical protein